MLAGRNARRTELAQIARENGYAPPGPKYQSQHDYRGRDSDYPIDYLQLLLDPQRTALLVIDMQDIFIQPGAPMCAEGGHAIVPTINKLVTTFRSTGQPVIWTAWCHRRDGSNAGPNSIFWPSVAPLPPDSDLARIHSELDFRPEDILIEKPSYSAFWATDLEAILKTLDVDSLVLTGIATDVCVGQTLIDAFHRDYTCVVVADGTATPTPYQEQTLWHHENYLGRVMTAEEVVSELLTLKGSQASLDRPS